MTPTCPICSAPAQTQEAVAPLDGRSGRPAAIWCFAADHDVTVRAETLAEALRKWCEIGGRR